MADYSAKLHSPMFSNPEKIDQIKNALRKEVREAKRVLSDLEKIQQSEKVFAYIEQSSEFQAAKTILMYWSMPDELPTHQFVRKWSVYKTVLLPIVTGGRLIFRPFESEDKLEAGVLNLMEPSLGEDFIGQIDLGIIPGVAFDRKKNRLGRGKAYYDQYLQDKNFPKWAVGFDLQLFDAIPTTPTDIPMDKVIVPREKVW